jgi:hypothetical protein
MDMMDKAQSIPHAEQRDIFNCVIKKSLFPIMENMKT